MENIALDLKVLSDLIEKKANSNLAQYDITISQARILTHLAHCGRKVPLKELEKTFKVSQATMQGVIARMEKKGLLCTVHLPADRKQKLVVLTEFGSGLAASIFNDISFVNKNLISSLTPDEQTEFLRILRKMKRSIE
ncbi:MAG: winged helix-turn-helix transcriptional regulator [Ruminococcaceae bacterium]|nr:winged helix-turn-helix transcriptional regulator [Oscillospiraceae bacterium]